MIETVLLLENSFKQQWREANVQTIIEILSHNQTPKMATNKVSVMVQNKGFCAHLQ